MQKTASKVRVGPRAATAKTVSKIIDASNNHKKPVIDLSDLDDEIVAKTPIIIEEDDAVEAETVDAGASPTAVKKGELNFIEGEDEDSSPFFNMLIGGRHKAGKSILATSCVDVPELGDILYADIDAGFKSVIASGVVADWRNITRVKVASYDTFLKLYKFANSHAKARARGDSEKLAELAAKFGVNPTRRFRTIIVDVINGIDRINLLDSYGNKDVALTRKVEAGNWGHATTHTTVMQDLLLKLRDLPMNVIFISHFKPNKDTKEWEPEMRGQLASLIQRNMDLVGFMNQGTSAMPNGGGFGADDDDDDDDDDVLISKKKRKAKKVDAEGLPIQRVMWLQPCGPFAASSRITPPDLKRIENPTMAKLWEHITPALRLINKNAA